MFRSTKAALGSVVPEYSGAQLGDERRARRLVAIARRIEAEPRTSFPGAMQSTAELEAFYRFINRRQFSPEQIVDPHQRMTLERAANSGTVLVVHDTMPAEFSGRTPRPGLGVTSTKSQFGFLAHVSLAMRVDEERTALGVIRFETFTRSGVKWSVVKKSRTKVRDDPQRESLRWWRAIAAVEKARQDRFEAIHVMDAEADCYELFSQMQDAHCRFVVRSGQAQRRTLADDESSSLRELANQLRPTTRRTIEVSARYHAKRQPRNLKKRHPARSARKARLAIASTTVDLAPTRYSKVGRGPVRVNLVRVWEPAPPNNAAPVEWLLLTNEPATTPIEFARIVDIYRARWTIEEYFKALKTGCSLEQRQINSYEGLRKVMALFVPIAYRLLLLRGLQRQRARSSARQFFSDVDLLLLQSDDATRELPPLRTLADAMTYVARMGGHLKQNGPPGWQTLARGYERLLALRAGWQAAIALSPALNTKKWDQS